MERELEGRTALVTGGARGIGRAVCMRLAKDGASVAINMQQRRRGRETQRLVEAAGAACTLLKADVSDPEAVVAMVAEAERALGPIDLLVTSAGIAPTEPRGEVAFETWRRVMAVNLDGTFLPMMAVKDGMIARGYGRIVCLASIAGPAAAADDACLQHLQGRGDRFARNCSEAFAPRIRINCIAPGLIDTDMPAASLTTRSRQRMVDATPLERIGQPEEMAELALFLLSERSSFIDRPGVRRRRRPGDLALAQDIQNRLVRIHDMR